MVSFQIILISHGEPRELRAFGMDSLYSLFIGQDLLDLLDIILIFLLENQNNVHPV
jgi:hypothetical protein